MGYFKIDRQLLDHWVWNEKPFSKGQAWIDLIGLANFKDDKTVYQGKVIECKRGTVYRSISFLANRWGWSRKKTRSYLRALESDEMVTIKVTTHRTTVTIENYGKFQDTGTTKGTTKVPTEEQQRNSKGTNERIKVNKGKEGEEIYSATARCVPPALEDVRSYCLKRGNGIDAEEFFDYYQRQDWKLSNGRKMTDWKAAVRGWEKRQQKTDDRFDNHPKQREHYEDLYNELFGN